LLDTIDENEEMKSAFDSDSSEESDDEEPEYELCGICRDQMKEAKKLPCSHKFHLQCLMGWMRYKHTCPICRHSLNDGSNDANANPPVVRPNNAAAAPRRNAGAANANNNDRNLLPWWLRIFGSFIQIHNVDIIDARNANGAVRRRGRAARPAQQRQQRVSTEDMINRISEVLGGTVSQEQIRTRLLRTHSVERTVEYFLMNPH